MLTLDGSTPLGRDLKFTRRSHQELRVHATAIITLALGIAASNRHL